MTEIYKYELKLKRSRKAIDLREYKAEIKFAIQSVFNYVPSDIYTFQRIETNDRFYSCFGEQN